MKLSKYMEENALDGPQMAKRAKISTVTMYKILQGSNISLETAMLIYYGSEKKVSPIELYEELISIKVAKAKKILAKSTLKD